MGKVCGRYGKYEEYWENYLNTKVFDRKIIYKSSRAGK